MLIIVGDGKDFLSEFNDSSILLVMVIRGGFEDVSNGCDFETLIEAKTKSPKILAPETPAPESSGTIDLFSTNLLNP